MTSIDQHPRDGSIARGVLLAALLGPFMLLGAAAAAIALLQLFISGWNPFDWVTDPASPITWIDWAFGSTGGSAARYVVFVIGGMVAILSYAAIHWGFTSRSPLD